MNNAVLSEIVEWSKDRPTWQRDALRRLFTTEQLSPEDLDELLNLCKAAHGLSGPSIADVLTEEHVAIEVDAAEPVALTSLTHHSGVNALAPEQTLSFGKNVTVVYGSNAAGKSGYTRILKRACRSRAAEKILGNVIGEEAPLKARATIRFSQGTKEEVLSLTPENAPSAALSAVSVFDSHCAPIYLRDKTDVAFRPFSLDIFDKLSAVCTEIRRRLEVESAALSATPSGLPNLSEGTKAQSVISNLTSLTSIDDVRSLATLSKKEEQRLKGLRDQQNDLQTANPKQRAQELKLKADRLQNLVNHVRGVGDSLSESRLTTLRSAIQSLQAAKDALTIVRNATLTPGLLSGSGEGAWKEMWDAAENFSGVAYPGLAFPVLAAGSLCPFCQQTIGQDSAARLMHFAEYVSSNAQAEVTKAEALYQATLAKITGLVINRTEFDLVLSELDADDAPLAQVARTWLQDAVRIQQEVKQATAQAGGITATGLSVSPSEALRSAAQTLRSRAAQLQFQAVTLEPKSAAELNDLEARSSLRDSLAAVLAEIERKKRLAAYKQCLDDTSTLLITRKSTELTKRLITDHLSTTFQEELSKLEFTHLDVEIRAAGGAKGALFHQLVFTNAPGVPVTDVLSEGESRTLSLAAFLTELSTATSKSAIIFDDPVSSLDHEWRGRIARRLITEAKDRQVIVFTHDILFLRLLLDESGRQQLACDHQYVRRAGQAGISSPDLPWVAMNTKDRIGVLKKQWQAADKLFRTSTPDAYEKDARDIYGLMREAWEQAAGEVLLNNVVERYRPSIETQRLKYLHDITEEDCKTVESAMAECSRWMRGHDHPAADGTPFPEPADLSKRIEELDAWVQGIRKRRK